MPSWPGDSSNPTATQTVRCLFAHDDPIEVWVNGERIYEGGQHFNGFESTWISLPLRKGRNEVVVRLTNYFNRNFNWTGFLFRRNWRLSCEHGGGTASSPTLIDHNSLPEWPSQWPSAGKPSR